MGLGKTITCVSLIAATYESARAFASSPLDAPPPPPPSDSGLSVTHFSGSVWGMPTSTSTGKGKAKAAKDQDRMEADYARACRIKTKSRATLIICPLSTVSNWEDQFREHWKGEVTVVGGGGGVAPAPTSSSQTPTSSMNSAALPQMSLISDVKVETKPPTVRIRQGKSLRVYVYHGNARRPDPAYLADFDAVITTFATLASEFSKQNRSATSNEPDAEEDEGSSDGGGVETDERGNQVLKLPKSKKQGLKRKKAGMEVASALQSVHWFRVVLDEAQ